MLALTQEQEQELKRLMRTAPQAYVRKKALALWNLSQGKTQREVATVLDVSRMSLRAWGRRYVAEGAAGLRVRPGRGRPGRADIEEITEVLHRSPRTFGLPQTRWTLASLGQAAPSLKGFTPAGIWYVLQRAGLSYKRAQPRITSPDPEYVEKRALAGSASGSQAIA